MPNTGEVREWNLHRWKVESGKPVTLEVESLRPNTFDAWLTYNIVGHSRRDFLGRTHPEGRVSFELSAAEVGKLATTSDYIFLGTEHHKSIGHTGDRWGYRYRLLQDGRPLECTDIDGEDIEASDDGWVNSPLRPFTNTVHLDAFSIDVHY